MIDARVGVAYETAACEGTTHSDTTLGAGVECENVVCGAGAQLDTSL